MKEDLTLKTYCKKIIKDALKSGIERIEVYGTYGETLSISVEEKISDYQLDIKEGICIRGQYHRGIGEIYLEKIDYKLIPLLIKQLKQIAETNIVCESLSLFSPGSKYEQCELYSEELCMLSPEEIANMARKIGDEILNEDKDNIVINQTSNITIALEEIILENSLGLSLYTKSNIGLAMNSVIFQKDKRCVSYFDVQAFTGIDEFAPKKIGKRMIYEGKKKLMNSARVKSSKYNTILNQRVMADLISRFYMIFSAEQIALGNSPIKYEYDKKIFSEQITIIDDPHIGYNRRIFDDEGVPTKKIIVISSGKIKNILHNQATAIKFHVNSTGHAVRNQEGEIGIGTSNFFIQNGKYLESELVEKMENGILITDLYDNFSGINIETGDFVCPCEGMIVKSGKIKEFAENIIISGNFMEMMKNVIAVGNNMEFRLMEGGYGSPSIYVGEMNIVSE